MSLYRSFVSNFFGTPQNKQRVVAEVNDVPLVASSAGTSGTEIYSGYITEDYLKELRGKEWADMADQMRRSDGNVTMILKALSLPLLSSPWFLQIEGDEDEEAKRQAELFEQIIFRDMSSSFTKLLGEILTFNVYGYSLFELRHDLRSTSKLGNYVTIARMAYRSQRTIEKWNLNVDTKELQSVEQQAYGDLQSLVNLDARFLVHFCPAQEGDNYEGIAVLRPCYGPYIRKNHYLKLIAAGTEKYAIPVPFAKVPNDKANSDEYKNLVAVLRKFTSNQSNYITYPEGWDIETKDFKFESDKVLTLVKHENQEMVNSVLASFLLLGQGDSGSRALGDTLSDFFGQTLQFQADHITEVFEQRIMRPMLRANFGHDDLRVSLKCDNLRDKADQSFATAISSLVTAGIIQLDVPLERFIRERFSLPEKDDETVRPNPAQQMTFAEKKSPKTEKIISGAAKDLASIIESGLSLVAEDYNSKVVKAWSDAPDRTVFSATKKIEPSKSLIDSYQAIVEARLLAQSFDLATDIKKQTASRKLAESDTTERLLKRIENLSAEFIELSEQYLKTPTPLLKSRLDVIGKQVRELRNDLRKRLRESTFNAVTNRVQAQAETLVSTQIGDIVKASDLQFGNSARSTDDADAIKRDLNEATSKKIGVDLSVVGAEIASDQNANNTILDVADSDDAVESYTFNAILDSDTTAICRELDGRTFKKGDPDLRRYLPPLHHNCRSYLSVNVAGRNNPQPETTSFKPSKLAQSQITLSECCHH